MTKKNGEKRESNLPFKDQMEKTSTRLTSLCNLVGINSMKRQAYKTDSSGLVYCTPTFSYYDAMDKKMSQCSPQAWEKAGKKKFIKRGTEPLSQVIIN